MKQKKICRYCQEEFIASRKDQQYCSRTHKENARQDRRGRPWVNFKKNNCEACGFVALHKCQLDVDHIDGDKKNNDPSNLRTLCANCHRIKTHLSGDCIALKYRKAK